MQGIAKPVEATMRPKGVGMGYGERREAQMVAPGKAAAEGKAKEEEVGGWAASMKPWCGLGLWLGLGLKLGLGWG
jgi:tuftelin-interacting protein 11